MANNYFVSSVTLYKEDNTREFKFGPFTLALIKTCSSWFDTSSGVGVCDEEDCNRQLESVLLTVYQTLTGDKKIEDDAGQFYILSYSTLLHLLDKHYGNMEWTAKPLIEYLSRCTNTEGYVDWSDILVIAKLETPDNNILGYSETYCNYCSKLRHDEFVGGGLFVSDVFSIHASPNPMIEKGHAITKCIMAKDFQKASDVFWSMFRDVINQVKGTSVQETIMTHLKKNIDDELQARQQAFIAATLPKVA